MNESEKKAFFEQTLALARKGWGNTHPNPMVGALIVEDGQIVAKGYHQKAGSPHAEVEAIRALDRVPQDGASMFVSLEPCSTT
ncbi:MAG: deaminase, partial [Opitutales bacterium]